MINQINNQWTRFWFAPESPVNLAICRILFYGAVLLFYLSRHYEGWALLPNTVYVPVTLLGRLGFPIFEPHIVVALEWVWKTGLLLCCIGLFTRPALLVTAIIGFYLLSMPHDFGKVNHNDQPLALVMCILAFSRCGDALSVDSWLRARFSPKASAFPSRSGEYRWPVRAVWLAMALIFFAAGVSKLRHGGLEWMNGETLAYHLVSHNYPFLSFQPWTDWGLWIAQWPTLLMVLAIGTVVTELFFPLALLHPVARALFVPAAFLMQLGIRLILGPHFEQYAMAYLFFVPWPWVLRSFKYGGIPRLLPGYPPQRELQNLIPKS